MCKCVFCGKETKCMRTHYGFGFGYVRLICSECQKVLHAEILVSVPRKLVKPGEIKDVR